jgi:hypothetical protein
MQKAQVRHCGVVLCSSALLIKHQVKVEGAAAVCQATSSVPPQRCSNGVRCTAAVATVLALNLTRIPQCCTTPALTHAAPWLLQLFCTCRRR